MSYELRKRLVFSPASPGKSFVARVYVDEDPHQAAELCASLRLAVCSRAGPVQVTSWKQPADVDPDLGVLQAAKRKRGDQEGAKYYLVRQCVVLIFSYDMCLTLTNVKTKLLNFFLKNTLCEPGFLETFVRGLRPLTSEFLKVLVNMQRVWSLTTEDRSSSCDAVVITSAPDADQVNGCAICLAADERRSFDSIAMA